MILYRENYLDQGALYGILAGLMIALVSIANRFAIVGLNIDIWPLMILQLFAGGICLLFVGYRSVLRQELQLLTHPLTWVIGFCRVGNLWCYLLALYYLSVTEAEFLLKWSVVIAIASSFVLHKVRPQGYLAWAGFMIMLIGLIFLTLTVSPIGMYAIFGAAVFLVLDGTAAEFHPEFQKTTTLRQHFMFSGAAMVITGIVAVCVWLSLSTIQSGTVPIAQFQILFNPTTLLVGITIGATLRSAFMLFNYRSIRLLTTSYNLMLSGLIPFFALAIESLLNFLGYLPTPSLSVADFIAGCVITTGSLLILVARMMQEQDKKCVHENKTQPFNFE